MDATPVNGWVNPYADAILAAAVEAARAERNAQAATLLKLIVGASPHDAYVLYVLGRCQYDLKQLDAAYVALSTAVAIDPYRAEAFNDLAAVLFGQQRFTEALTFLRRCLDLNPNLAEAEESDGIWLLRYGRFKEGWRKYEARYRTLLSKSYKRDFTQPQWYGEPLNGRTILLHAEQGIGDAIQFARYAPLVARRGARVILEVHPPLAALFDRMDGVMMTVAFGQPLPKFDLHCPLLSLPLACDTDLDSLPAAVPYVAAPPNHALYWSNRLGVRRARRIGVVWSGNPKHRDDDRRSIPLDAFAKLLAPRPGLEFHSLQKDIRDGDREVLQAMPHVRQHGDALRDFRDTAALIGLMDLVIAVDTSVAHLAGAMGWPVWTLISAIGDWRWMLERDDSPWYPSMTLFRQERLGNWTPVLEEVARQLDDMLT